MGRAGAFASVTSRRALVPVAMLALALAFALSASAPAAGAGSGPCGSGTLSTDGTRSSCTYTTAGQATFGVPAGVTTVSVTAVGAAGGDGGSISASTPGAYGGTGAVVTAPDVAVSGLDTLYVEIGGPGGAGTPAGSSNCPGGAGGANGGGAGGAGRCEHGSGGGGGGASDVRTEPASAGGLTAGAADPRLVVAAGGGGGGGAYIGSGTQGAQGGAAAGNGDAGAGAGGSINCDDDDYPSDGGEGEIGPGGGAGGGISDSDGCPGTSAGLSGAPGAGGAGGDGNAAGGPGSGGGGGGYSGGGGGAAAADAASSGGGAGSSYGPPGATVSGSARGQAAEVVISWSGSSAAAATTTGAPPPAGAELPGTASRPDITGTARPAGTLTCSDPGASPARYVWLRNGTPIPGATRATYVIRSFDEGSTVSCAVAAAASAGAGPLARSAGVAVPVPRIAGCPAASGTVSARAISAIKLGMTRSRARQALPKSSRRTTARELEICLTPDGIRAGLGSRKLLERLGIASAGHYLNRIIWVATANARYAVDGVRSGEAVALARTRVALSRAFVIGPSDWYLTRDGGVSAVYRARHGVVTEVGIADRAVAGDTRARQRAFLASLG